MRLVSWVAIGLWVVTVAVGGTLFVRGSTEAAPDGREAIQFEPAERDLVLSEMRGMLAAVEGILTASLEGDAQAIETAARSGGMAAAEGVPPSLMLKLPLDFKRMGMDTHAGFDAIAQAVAEGETREMILDRLSSNLQRCVACHSLYRLR